MYQHTDPVALWAEAQVTALGGGELPLYGTRAWRELPADDPRRVAAILTAAEQWRRERVEAYWLDQLAEEDPEAWWIAITEEAETEARRTLRRLQVSRLPKFEEIRARRAQYRPAHQLQATPGWPPIAVPGKPGCHRHLISGRQTDLNSATRETAA